LNFIEHPNNVDIQETQTPDTWINWM